MLLPTSSPLPPVEHRLEMLRAQRAWHRALRRDRASLRQVWRFPTADLTDVGDRLIWQYGLTREFFADPSRTLMMAAAASISLARAPLLSSSQWRSDRRPGFPSLSQRDDHPDTEALLHRTMSHFAELFGVTAAPSTTSFGAQFRRWAHLHANAAATAQLNKYLRGPELADKRAELGIADGLDHFDLIAVDFDLPHHDENHRHFLRRLLQSELLADYAGWKPAMVAEVFALQREMFERFASPGAIAATLSLPGERPLVVLPTVLVADLQHPFTGDTLFHEVMHTHVDLKVPGLGSGRMFNEVAVTTLAQDANGYLTHRDRLLELAILNVSWLLPDRQQAATPHTVHLELCQDLGPRRFLRLMELGSDGKRAADADRGFALLLDAALDSSRGYAADYVRERVDARIADMRAEHSDVDSLREHAAALTSESRSVLSHLAGRRVIRELATDTRRPPAAPPHQSGTPRR